MHLSTSNSNERLPSGHWGVIWLGSLIIVTVFMAYFEIKIRGLGVLPSLVDSKELWAEHRKRASSLGNKAIILVGASRMQLNIDMDVVKSMTNLEPIQLAIDGSPTIPVLEDLANDVAINSVVLVSIDEAQLNTYYESSQAKDWVASYHKQEKSANEIYRRIDNYLKRIVDQNLVTHLEGAKPATIITLLGVGANSAENYLVTHLNRSRDADYLKVNSNDVYAERIKRNYGKNLINNQKLSYEKIFSIYEKEIENLGVSSNKEFLNSVNKIVEYIQKIENRGGKVVLIRFPSDKLIWKIDEKRYPRDAFWKELEKKHKNTIYFKDYPELSKYELPDGSHLDFRDKNSFTKEILRKILAKIT